MLNNTIIDSEVQSGIIKTDVSEHCSVCFDGNKFGTTEYYKNLHKMRY